MKKTSLLIVFFCLLSIFLRSQTSDYFSLLSYLQNNTNESSKDRIISVALWSPSDMNSREAIAELNKACHVFKNAKLKGGNKGIIGILICTDTDEVTANITLKKEGITNVIVMKTSELASFPGLSKKQSSYNIVFDSNGNVIYENLASNSVFNSIRNLITR